MHAIERPHLPRIGVPALGAVLLAVVVLLLAASRVGDNGISFRSASSGAPTAPPAEIHSGLPVASSWFTSPFAAPVRVVLPWHTARR
jgi:hypothetical protein